LGKKTSFQPTQLSQFEKKGRKMSKLKGKGKIAGGGGERNKAQPLGPAPAGELKNVNLQDHLIFCPGRGKKGNTRRKKFFGKKGGNGRKGRGEKADG